MYTNSQSKAALAELDSVEEEVMTTPECSAVAMDHIWYDSLGD